MREAWDTPWKIRNQIESWVSHPLVRIKFAWNGIPWGRAWRFHGLPIIMKHRHSEMSFGSGLGLRSSIRANPLGANHPVILCTWRAGSVLRVGENFAMTGGTLCAAQSIVIGSNVVVGANTVIADTDFHPLQAGKRMTSPSDGACAPIVIEDDVFIGMECLVLKGVTLGHGSVIGAGSIVTQDVPAGWVAAGNPARALHPVEGD